MSKAIEEMREASGHVTSNEKISALLYLLARDHLPVGKLEEAIDEIINCNNNLYVFTNGWLANWAKYSAERLKK